MTSTSRAVAIATAASLALTSGCATRSASGMLAGVGVAVATVGIAAYANDTSNAPDDSRLDIAAPLGKALISLGVVMIAGGVIGFLQASPDATVDDVATTDAATSAESREADRLAMRAAHAASAGDCAMARQNIAMLQAMDRDYASALVAHDTQIAACVGR